ncbi:hypothetical protein NQ318_005001 [Aromia moschata]|uniref:Zinc finger protein n=1 Tax=Aromia moschata TaxID=1265417 RepID=A0AAV8Y8P0_9CUCU|nr:hypothetical protein NQ318_005001 [Aromia moschata]
MVSLCLDPKHRRLFYENNIRNLVGPKLDKIRLKQKTYKEIYASLLLKFRNIKANIVVVMNPSNSLYQCRLCLKRTPTKINVLSGDFPRMIEILTSIKVKENDGLPKYSCTKCAQDVKIALITKKRIIKAHKLLTESLRKKKVDIVEKKIIDALGENSAIKIIDTSQPHSKPILEKNSSGSHFSGKINCVSAQKPIEFVDVKSATLSNDETIIDKIKTEYEEVSLTVTKIEQSQEDVDTSLQNVIDEVMGSVKKNLTCETCNITFKDRSSYYTHCGKHKKTLCQICHHLIRTDNFKKHLLLHTSGPTVCNLCGATCKNVESLRGHIFYQHKSTANEYTCEICGRHFRIKYKFELHKKKEHIGIRNFKCETCGKGFFTNGNLMSHINMTHKKLRPYICEFCGIGFSSSYSLKTHKRQHTNEKPFKCQFCPEGFRQKVSLRSHLKSKHNIEEAKEHFCKDCNKGFATTYALSIHARLHMAQKCEVCSETFAEKEYLQNHLKDAHNIIVEEDDSENVKDEEKSS